MESGWGPTVLSSALSCTVLQPQYRLSVAENASFPAALQDAITVYAYVLRTLHVPHEQVILSGDSAGGNLVLAMLRYLGGGSSAAGGQKPTCRSPLLPLPRAALLWSPWVDLTRTAEEKASSHPRQKMDYTFAELVAWGRERFIPPGWEDEHSWFQSQNQAQTRAQGASQTHTPTATPTAPEDKFAYLSPLQNEFYTPTPVFLQTGTAEMLYEDHVQFARGMKDQGTKVEVVEIANAPHDTFGAGLIVGFVEEAQDAARKAAAFVNAN
ncbi:Alpha/Beta hydrolase protein [Aspergillus stella-maris]|uniref:Alpha/Beta hydrolase protein n=1 Tax=Aspergillus stella-maris TaxID=1810926 RepID=UPI003CCCED4F